MPSHTHTIASETHKHSNVTSDSASRTGGKRGSKNGDDGGDGDSSTGTSTVSGYHYHDWGGSCYDYSSHNHTCPYYPEDQVPHSNLMPYITLNYIIKY
jgi:hypothetical protein